MKNTPFLLLLLGLAFVWLGLTGRLGAMLAALFEPDVLTQTTGSGDRIPQVVLPENAAIETAPAEPVTPEVPPSLAPGGEMPPVDITPGNVFDFPIGA